MNIGSSQDKNYTYGVFIKDIIDLVNEDLDQYFQMVNDPSIASLVTKVNKFNHYFRNVDDIGMILKLWVYC